MSALFDLKIPIFWDEGQPEINYKSFKFSVSGLVGNSHTYYTDELYNLSKDKISARLTSVTRWSVRLEWEGISGINFLKIAEPLPEALYVKFVSYGEKYFTVVPLDVLKASHSLIATRANGEALPVEYGGPVRALFPQLWGYKSAKSIVKAEFVKDYCKGYWESRGYSDSADIQKTKIFDINAKTTKFHNGGEVKW